MKTLTNLFKVEQNDFFLLPTFEITFVKHERFVKDKHERFVKDNRSTNNFFIIMAV